MKPWSIQNVELHEVNGNGLARYGVWNVNEKKLETPALFVSWSHGRPCPWEVTNIHTTLVSAYDVYRDKAICDKVQERGIHVLLKEKYPSFVPQKNIILMDSGGFTLLRTIEDTKLKEAKLQARLKVIEAKEKVLFPLYGKKSEEPLLLAKEKNEIENDLRSLKNKLETLGEEVNSFSNALYNIYSLSKPDLAAVLDFPIDPKKNDVAQRIRFSKENIRKMCGWNIDLNGKWLTIMPIVHPVTSGLLKYLQFTRFERKPRTAIEAFLDEEIRQIVGHLPAIAIGSLIPLLMHRAPDGREEAIKAIAGLRETYRLKFLHAFGAGGTVTLHLAFYLGADSVDCAGWRRRAIYRIIQLPGVGDRYISEKTRKKMKWKGIQVLSREECKILDECECPACKEHSPEELENSFKLLSIHNLYTYCIETSRARESIREGNYERFVEERLKRSKIHRNLFNQAKQLVRNIRMNQEFRQLLLTGES